MFTTHRTDAFAPCPPSIIRWTPLQRQKVAYATAMLIAQGFSTGQCLTGLTKDHLVKDCTLTLL